VSIEPGLTTTTLIFASVLGLFLAGLDRLLSSLVIERLTRSILVIGVSLALVGIVQRASPQSPIYGFWHPEGGTSNAFGPFINRNHFAGWMVMACGLGLGYFQGLLAEKQPQRTWHSRLVWLGSREGTRVVLTSFALGTMMLATTWSISRSGITSLVVVVVTSILFGRPTRSRPSSARFARAIVISLMLLAALWRGLDVLADRFTTPDSLITRLAAWRDTWSIIKDFPLTGTGLNTYTVATLFYQRSNEGFHLAEAHNDYLQLMSDGGFLVTIPVVGTIVAIIRVVRTRWTSPPPSVRIGAVQRGAALGLLGIAVQEMAEFSLQKPANALLFVILLAIAMYEPCRSQMPPRAYS
jgi:O-antigen ligase